MLDGGGLLWVDPPSLTLSFPADGTDVAGVSNSLQGELDSQFDHAAWRSAIEQAFQTWADAIGGQVTVVEDGGQPLGTLGLAQGDPRFGDIRVVAIPLEPGLTAMSVPHSAVVSGTWAGDVIFNSTVDFTNLDDLYSVALHEAGHVFGLDHSTDPASPMFTHGISSNLVPTAGDIARLKSLYGVRVESSGGTSNGGEDDRENEDRSGHGGDNDSLFWAESLAVPPLPDQLARYEVHGSIATADDVDYYRLQPASIEFEGNELLTVTVRSGRLNGAILGVKVYDEDGRLVDTEIVRNDNGVFVAQAEGVEPDEPVYLEVYSAADDVRYETGDYQVVATFAPGPVVLSQHGEIELDGESPVVEWPMHLDETQLAFFVARMDSKDASDGALASVVIYDDQGESVYRTAVGPGETRSAPSVLLDPGDYRVVFDAYLPEGAAGRVKLEFAGDSISLPFGPGLTDPTANPVLPCNQAGADPAYCLPPDVAVTAPIIIWPGTPRPATQPVVSQGPPQSTPDRWYWDTVRATQLVPRHLPQRPADVNNDGRTTPQDILIVVQYLNAAATGQILDAVNWYVDVNNDGSASPIDALLVIRHIAGA